MGPDNAGNRKKQNEQIKSILIAESSSPTQERCGVRPASWFGAWKIQRTQIGRWEEPGGGKSHVLGRAESKMNQIHP